jgi:glycosyltransferase involved in cell wall biosynthesis
MNNSGFSVDDVCVVICARNAEETIERVIRGAKEAGVAEILVVDGSSEDKTVQKSEALGARICVDEGKGLGLARNLGARHNTLPLTFFVGPDNVINTDLVQTMLDDLNSVAGVVACGCLTKSERSNYLGRALTTMHQTLMRPGFSSVLGTPTLIRTDLLLEHPYSSSRRFSDDSELFERIGRLTDARFWVSSVGVSEIGTASLAAIWIRWKNYGVSDFENFMGGKSSGWSAHRMLRSILYPVRRQLGQSFRVWGFRRWGFFLPVFLFMTLGRYLGWLQEVRRHSKSLPKRS